MTWRALIGTFFLLACRLITDADFIALERGVSDVHERRSYHSSVLPAADNDMLSDWRDGGRVVGSLCVVCLQALECPCVPQLGRLVRGGGDEMRAVGRELQSEMII